MARSHWRFPQASDFLGLEAIYLDIFTLAIFPSDFYVYFICLFTKINRSLEWVQHPFLCKQFLFSLEKIANLNSTIENTSTNWSKKKIARFSLENIANVNKP